MEDDLKAQLVGLIQEGNAIVTEINGQVGRSTLFSLAKLAAYFMLSDDDWEALQDVEEYVRSLRLPGPVQRIYVSYVSWNRKGSDIFRKQRWENDERIEEFGRLRREFGKETSKKEPRLQLLNAYVSEQVSILESVLDDPPRARGAVTKAKEIGWSTRRIAYVCAYIASCAMLDLVLLPVIGWSIVALIGVEVAILFGFPKLADWLRK